MWQSPLAYPQHHFGYWSEETPCYCVPVKRRKRWLLATCFNRVLKGLLCCSCYSTNWDYILVNKGVESHQRMPWSPRGGIGPPHQTIQGPASPSAMMRAYNYDASVPSTSALPNTGHLSDEVFRKLRQVDQETSTLTAQGVRGLSARTLDRQEYRIGKGFEDVNVVQTVEIIKKPGQSLGVYLREGNGNNRFTGVFVSRYGLNSELARYGELVRPGDEILSVNNVEVSGMSIDDVVLMLSIPRRLLLKTRYVKNHRDMPFPTTHGAHQRSANERTVLLFQKSDGRDSRRDSTHSGVGILSKPVSTASSWLGKRVRQQKQEQQQQQSQRTSLPVVENNPGSASNPYHPYAASGSEQTMGERRLNFYPHHQASMQQMAGYNQGMPGSGSYYENAAFYPQPPREGGGGRRSIVAHSGPNLRQQLEGSCPQQQWSVEEYPQNYQAYHQGVASSSPGLAYRNHSHAADLHYKSNSLPRRCIPLPNAHTLPSKAAGVGQPRSQPMPARTVKWRNDVVSPSPGSIEALVTSPSFTPRLPPYYPRHYPSPLLGGSAATTTVVGGDYASTSRAAYSDVEGSTGRCYRPFNTNPPYHTAPMANGAVPRERGSGGRTIADVFSAQEYRNWAAPSTHTQSEVGMSSPHYYPSIAHHRSRWADHSMFYAQNGDSDRGGASIRSNSLPSRSVLASYLGGSTSCNRTFSPPTIHAPRYPMTVDPSAIEMGGGPSSGLRGPYSVTGGEASDVLDRLHISPLTSRRVPLRAAGSGFDVDRLSVNALYGVLSVSVVEGKGLRVPDKTHSKQLYVVLEVNEVHRARTGISTPEQHFRWDERFEIDVYGATDAQFFIYAWHPQLRHRFCYKGSMRLLDAFFIDQLSGNRMFALSLEPRGQLIIKLAFTGMAQSYRRTLCTEPGSAIFGGVPLNELVQREQKDTPVALSRLLKEIEERGVDTPGLYSLCGAVEGKNMLKRSLDRDSANADLGMGPVPDINLLACAVKDFLRELPEPLIPPNIYGMLADANAVIPPADREGNQKFLMRIVDCLPTPNKNTLILLMDHLRNVLASEPHNGLNSSRLAAIFGPLLLCSAAPMANQRIAAASPTAASGAGVSGCGYKSSVKVNPLDSEQASSVFKLLLELWPSRVSKSSDKRMIIASQTPAAQALRAESAVVEGLPVANHQPTTQQQQEKERELNKKQEEPLVKNSPPSEAQHPPPTSQISWKSNNRPSTFEPDAAEEIESIDATTPKES